MDKDNGRLTGPVPWGLFAAKSLVLVAALAVAGVLLFLAAARLRGIVLEMPAKDSGEWASLLGGGFAVWAFFLIRSEIIDKALDLIPKARDMLVSLGSPDWSGFGGSLGNLARTMAMPGIVTVFALVFVGESVRDQVVKPAGDIQVKPPAGARPDDLHVKIDDLEGKVDSLSQRVDEGLGRLNLRNAMNDQGYTEHRAGLLDNLEVSETPVAAPPDAVAGRRAVPGCASGYYFARFAISFDRAMLNEERTALVAGVDRKSVRNPELAEQIVRALLPCGADDGADPVVLKVEGYASSERFRSRPGSADDSDYWNVRTANERRRTVARMLEQAVGNEDGHRFVVCESEDYVSLADMQKEREFNDRPRGRTVGRLPQDLLTLAAHVKVLHPGICRVDAQIAGGSPTTRHD